MIIAVGAFWARFEGRKERKLKEEANKRLEMVEESDQSVSSSQELSPDREEENRDVESTKAEQGAAGQPATRSESK